MSGDDFLSRWSRRKHAAKAGAREEAPPQPVPAPETGPTPPPTASEEAAGPPLPPVESLRPDSDFTPFMRPGVDPGLRQQALRTLVRDPRFNVMDGLDVYIDDYSKPDPIPADWLGKLNQMARLGDCWPKEEKDEARTAAPQDGADPENPLEEQQVASNDPASPADTLTAGLPPSELKKP